MFTLRFQVKKLITIFLPFHFVYLGFNPEKNSYHTSADNLKQFEHINELPIQLKRRCALYYVKANLVEAFQFSINRVLRNSINRSCRENENIKKLLMMKKKGHQIKKIYDHWRFVTELADRQNQRMI